MLFSWTEIPINTNQSLFLLTVNPQVPGSSPGRGAKEFKGLDEKSSSPFFFSGTHVDSM
jgi:hypothetical protein